MDLRTTYMGLELKHPIVASASPLSESLDNIKRMEDAGAAAVVMFSLFEEQIRHESAAMEHFMSSGANSFPESLSYFPDMEHYHAGPETYLDLLRRASDATDIPIIGSLNGATSEGWADIARQMQEAGAAGIELNIYYIPADPDLTGRQVEERYLDVVKSVKSAVSVPVALKLSPFFSSIGHMAKELDQAGADALVLFNRFYQPDFDLDHLEVKPNLSLSSPSEIRLPLLWIAILYRRIQASLGATRGVHSPAEVLKYILAGADVVMTTSALLRNGIGFIGELVTGLDRLMAEKGYESVGEARGIMSQLNVADPSAFERANYIRVLESYATDYKG
jgi:dihydroorotate dehydrogenase (fumarate)